MIQNSKQQSGKKLIYFFIKKKIMPFNLIELDSIYKVNRSIACLIYWKVMEILFFFPPSKFSDFVL